jgi:membrane protein
MNFPRLRLIFESFAEATDRFLDDDGWAIASHLALSSLMSLFPFLIFVTTLASFFGSKELADEVARLMLEAWPETVAKPIIREISSVLTSFRGDLLTIGVILAIYFSSNGVEALRIGLNRAYGVKEWKGWWRCRVQSVAYVLIGACVLLALAFLVVLGPLIWSTFLKYFPQAAPLSFLVTFLRLFIATGVIVLALIIVHLWLPAGKRPLGAVLPGIALTLLFWVLGGIVFGHYLNQFAFGYVTAYAGLASFMIAIVFLYCASTIFIYGGEFNAALQRRLW